MGSQPLLRLPVIWSMFPPPIICHDSPCLVPSEFWKDDLFSHADTCGICLWKHVLYFHERIQNFFGCLLNCMFQCKTFFFHIWNTPLQLGSRGHYFPKDIIYNNYSMSPRVGYNHFISNKGEWNKCLSKFSNRVLPPIFISTILQSENVKLGALFSIWRKTPTIGS